MRLLEYHKFGKEKTNRETNEEGHDIGRDITIYRNAAPMYQFIGFARYYLCMDIRQQQEIVTDKVDKKAQYRNATATGNVPERLDWYPFAEYRVKKINDL